jgi:hypothetical protein
MKLPYRAARIFRLAYNLPERVLWRQKSAAAPDNPGGAAEESGQYLKKQNGGGARQVFPAAVYN